MPLHALEFVLDSDSDAAIRAEWQALADAGLPSQARHSGATNAPHITFVSAQIVSTQAEDVATRAVVPLLPMPVMCAGVVVFGRGPFTLARLLAADSTLTAAVAQVREEVPQAWPPMWVPHVTLARRLTAAQVGAAMDVLGALPRIDAVTLAGLRRWDPDLKETRPVPGSPGRW